LNRLLVLCLGFALFAGCSASEHSAYYSSESIKEPQIFAKGVISKDLVAAPRFSPDGKTLFFHKPDSLFGQYQIFVSYYVNDAWTTPVLPPFANREASEGDMYYSPDGSKLFFVSNREPADFPERQWTYGLWMVEKTDSGWSKPTYLSEAVNNPTESIAYPTVANSGNIYFISNGFYVSRFTDGQYQPRELIQFPDQAAPTADFIPYIAPDESYLLLSGREAEAGATMYIRYNHNGVWSSPQQLSDKLKGGRFPFVSPDGKYLFFSKDDGIYQLEMSETGIKGS
jgi:Tol biopolymer transport system component